MNRYCHDFAFDLGPEFDDFAAKAREAGRQFGERMRDMAENGRAFAYDYFYRPAPLAREGHSPTYYSFPPANIYKDAEGALVLQFALAGFDEAAVKVGFQEDWLVLTARQGAAAEEEARYERRSFRPRDVERQKYYVPAADYDQAAARAVFKAGLLTVTVPAKDIPEADAIRINIVKEGS
jgi:HSP20 family molecular chaperone IbpA